jgi:hypothetical protein
VSCNLRTNAVIESSDEDEAEAVVPQQDCERHREAASTEFFPPTPIPSSARHLALFVDAKEQAFLDAEAEENEKDPDADLEEDEDEEPVGFGQERSPFRRRSGPPNTDPEEDEEEQLVGFGQERSPFRRRSGPPNTDNSSDEELDLSHQATRKAKGKGRAPPEEDDDDDNEDDEPDEEPNGENSLY